MASPAYSVTRKEIEGFWRRKETEEEERRFAAEKEAARTKAKTLKVRPCISFLLAKRRRLNHHPHHLTKTTKGLCHTPSIVSIMKLLNLIYIQNM